MKTIIAPVDFSTVSENSSLYAAKLTADIKTDLVLLQSGGDYISHAEL